MLKFRLNIILTLVFFPFLQSDIANALSCENFGKITYNPAPEFYSPDDQRTVGLLVSVDSGTSVPPADIRPGCLPISFRYNNPGAVKTRSSGFWDGQIAKDKKGHAVFDSVQSGVSAWVLLMRDFTENRNLNTAFKIMNIYAPATGCVGDVGTPPNDCDHGLNPTEEYARKVANAVGRGPHDKLDLNPESNPNAAPLIEALFTEIATFEAGANFCNKECSANNEIFKNALAVVWGAN